MGKRFGDIDWYCDNCKSYLNIQPGFSDDLDSWRCTECGHVSPISAESIRWDEGSVCDDRMSARYIAQRLGVTAKWVYQVLEEHGLVEEDTWGEWTLTEKGRRNGGRMSKGNYPVPTFKFNVVEEILRDHM